MKIGRKQCLIINGKLPKTICHPVTATGSLLVQVNLIKIVPNAIASEAASIQSSPKLKTTSFIALSDINHQFSKNSWGTPKNTIPPKPKSNPNHPIGLIKLPKIALAKIATKRVENQSIQSRDLLQFFNAIS